MDHHLFELELHLRLIEQFLIDDMLGLVPDRGHCKLSLNLVAPMKPVGVQHFDDTSLSHVSLCADDRVIRVECDVPAEFVDLKVFELVSNVRGFIDVEVLVFHLISDSRF